jgi:DNA helicase II / ATP-dependent DNA helicase PcrA
LRIPHHVTMQRHKYSKNLFTHKTGGNTPHIVVSANENLQSKFVVQKVLELREEGTPLDDIAVLFRSSFLSFDLEIELNKAGIPYIKFGGFKFMETAHIKDLVSYLKVLENPRDVVAWNRILLLVDGVGPRTAERVIEDILARRVNGGGGPARFWKQYNDYPDKLEDLFGAVRSVSGDEVPPADKVGSLLNYYTPLFKNKYDDYRKRQKDLEMFQNICERYRSVSTLLADLALEPPNESVSDISPVGTENEHLVLSTIHSAKGLEWHSVFVIFCLEGRFPSYRAAEEDEEMDEERRLMYVACTRAKENLYLTYPLNIYDRESGLILSKPSRFLDGLDNFVEYFVVDVE